MNKTVEHDGSVEAFLASVENEARRADAFSLAQLMAEASGFPPRMWGTAIVGYGSIHYRYESGREGDNLVVGFSPRKQNFALYGLQGPAGAEALLARLGKHSLGKGCVYLNRLAEVDESVLRELISLAVRQKAPPT